MLQALTSVQGDETMQPGSNYDNDTLVLGFSDLNRLRRERPMVLTGGRGVFVFDEHGRDYIEAVSSFFCVALGYSEPELVEAAMRQLRTLPMYPSAAHRTVPVVMELAEKLKSMSPIPNAHVAFATTGSEANDHLIKFMWFGNVHAGEPRRRKIVSRRGSYHGSTVLLTGLGGSEALAKSFGIPSDDFVHVSHPDWPAAAQPGESEEEYTARLARELDGAILAAGPETVSAMIAEPVSVSAGMLPPPAGYFDAVRNVLDSYGIQLFIDEVVTGFGRTGNMWGCETLGIAPDCLTSAKGLSSAYQPISAILMSDEFHDRIERASGEDGWFAHAGTYHAHPVAAAVALKTLEIFERRDILGHVRRVIPVWHRALRGLGDHPLVAGVRLFGLTGAVALRRPGVEASRVHTLKVGGLGRAAYDAGAEQGVLVRPVGDSVVMAPPLVITEAEIEELVRRLQKALDEVLATSS
jgi:4-aminobutyrate---pyruvate transaminase